MADRATPVCSENIADEKTPLVQSKGTKNGRYVMLGLTIRDNEIHALGIRHKLLASTLQATWENTVLVLM